MEAIGYQLIRAHLPDSFKLLFEAPDARGKWKQVVKSLNLSESEFEIG